MKLTISNASGKPIYEQIVDQLKALILSESLQEGDPLPSMRLLAKELRISVITTKRAYEELEREGFLFSVPGKGSFVAAKNPELIREEHLRKMEEALQAAAENGRLCGLSAEAFSEAARMFFDQQD